jgi:cytochrome P450
MVDLTDLFGGHFMSPLPDPHATYRRLRAEQPVAGVGLPFGTGYLVTRYDDVVEVLRDGMLYSSRSNAKGIGLVMGRTILEMDGKEHARHRNIISMAFVPRALGADLRATIERLAQRLIDAFVRDGRADLVEDFAKTFPLRVIAHVIGVPIEDYDTFQRWSLAVIGFTSDPPAGFAAAEALVDFLRPIVERRRLEPCGDLLSTLVHAEVDGERLSEEEILGFLKLLMPAGAETTYRLIGSTLFALLHHPAQLEAVRADRARVRLAIEETLRWESPVQLASRETTVPTSLGGVDLPAGAQVLACLGAANRDERHFPDPDRFDIDRHADDHVAFGFGRHFCLGSHLARLEATTALNAILDRLPNLRLDSAHSCQVVGLAFRSPDRLPVRFDSSS